MAAASAVAAESTPAPAAASSLPSGTSSAADGEWFRFEVDLSVNNIVSFKKLVRDKRAQQKRLRPRPSLEDSSAPEAATASLDAVPATGSSPPIRPPVAVGGKRTFNFIEQLEIKYGGGLPPPASSDDSDGGGAAVYRSSRRRARSDDEYESDFIDDSLIIEQEDSLKKSEKIVTKHDGFFVNGGSLETTSAPKKWRKSGKPSAITSGKAKKRDVPGNPPEDGEVSAPPAKKPQADSTAGMSKLKEAWAPSAAAQAAVSLFEQEVKLWLNDNKFGKGFPKALQDRLAVADKAILAEHPNAHGSRGYFEALMAFLPYSYKVLRTTILRVGTRHRATEAKARLDAEMGEMKRLVKQNSAAQIEEMRSARQEGKEWSFSWDAELRQALQRTIVSLQDWITAENGARERMNMSEKRAAGLDVGEEVRERKEKASLFTEMVAMWPAEMNVDDKELKKYHALERSKDLRKGKRASDASRASDQESTKSASTVKPKSKAAKKSDPSAAKEAEVICIDSEPAPTPAATRRKKRQSTAQSELGRPAPVQVAHFSTSEVFDEVDFVPENERQR